MLASRPDPGAGRNNPIALAIRVATRATSEQLNSQRLPLAKNSIDQRSWPTKVGIDEHLFKHDSRLNTRRFVTMIVHHKNKRLMEVVEGKEGAVLNAALEHNRGRHEDKHKRMWRVFEHGDAAL